MNHPPIAQLAAHLRDVAKLLDTHDSHNRADAINAKCRCVECRARLLGSGARGFPTGTLGDGTGSRGSDNTSSTERAAGLLADRPDPWATIDEDLDRQLRTLWHEGLRTATLIDRIVAHAPDDDPIPAGTGPCTIRTCETVCRPTGKDLENRLKSGLCPTCYRAWARYLKANPTAALVEWKPTRTKALRPKPIAS